MEYHFSLAEGRVFLNVTFISGEAKEDHLELPMGMPPPHFQQSNIGPLTALIDVCPRSLSTYGMDTCKAGLYFQSLAGGTKEN